MKHAFNNCSSIKRIPFFSVSALGVVLTATALTMTPSAVYSVVNPSVIITLSGAQIKYSSLATADFNGDGYKEIVAGGIDGVLYVVSTSDGVHWNTVWERQCNLDIAPAVPPTYRTKTEIASHPAIADLDNDGHLDIVIGVGGDVHEEDNALKDNGGILVYRYNYAWNFTLIEGLAPDGSRGWPQPRIDQVGDHCIDHTLNCPTRGFSFPDGFWDGVSTTPALCDIDGDNDLEIVLQHIDRRIYAWHHTGQLVAGWPIYRYGATGADDGDALLRGGKASVACADIDGDGLPEVIAPTMSPPWNRSLPISATNPDYAKGTMWAINGDSTNVPGFPVATEQYIYSAPAVADVDNDGFMEIVVSSGFGTIGRVNTVTIYNHDGSILPNWPQVTAGAMMGTPVLGDLNNDGWLDIVAGCGSEFYGYRCGEGNAKLYAWNVHGAAMPGFPMEPPVVSTFASGAYGMPYDPILADLDGDRNLEILITSPWKSQGVTVISSTGNVMEGRTMGGAYGVLLAAPMVDDIDRDGKIELLIGGGSGLERGTIAIWEENGFLSNAPWAMTRKNMYRLGTQGPESETKVVSPMFLLLLNPYSQ